MKKTSTLLCSLLFVACATTSLFSQTIAGGNYHTHAICGDTTIISKQSQATATGGLSVISWGMNNYGQLGDGTNGTPACTCGNPNCCKNTPQTLPSSANFIAISGGAAHTLMLRNDNTVWSYGRGTFGSLGNGGTSDANAPVAVSISNVKAIAAGSGYHSLFLKNDGTVWACGYNFDGELGDGTNGAAANKLSPVQVLGLTGIIAIAAGEKHSLFLKNDGTVWATGYNGYGQLGDNTTVAKNTPFQIPGLSNIVAIGAGDMHSLFVQAGGSVMACGRNFYGQVGDGTNLNNRLTPVSVSSTLTNVIAVDGGYGYSMFLRSDGTVYSCGFNSVGQLGDGTNTDKSTPVQMLSLSNIVTISAGYYHNISLKNNGTLWLTGQGSSGEIGDGTYASYNSAITLHQVCPIQIIGIHEFASAADKFKVYPIVSQGMFKIEGEGETDLISIYNMQGQKVYETTKTPLPNTVNISSSSEGMYMLQVKSGNAVLNKKIIVSGN